MKYAVVLTQVEKLRATREKYLLENDWVKVVREDKPRYKKTIPWGTNSEKTVEGDLNDAVIWQAKRDGDIE